jgi:CDP-diacylglycerol--glycerol-3-phosphate 3-phosphatidyltransferase
VTSLSGRIISKGDGPASNANIANIITVVRILLAPLFIWMLLADDGELGPLRYAAAALFVIAIVTDSLDGHLARSRNLITDLGKILDPIADKVLIGAALVALSLLGELWWWVTIVILVREFGITIFRFAALRSRVIAADWSGKLKTVVQAVAVSLLLFPFWVQLGEWYHVVGYVLIGVALALTVYSGIDFLLKAWRSGRPSS